jgi:hypothetical protein
MNIALILAFAFTLTTGMALTAAFSLGLIPLGFWKSALGKLGPFKCVPPAFGAAAERFQQRLSLAGGFAVLSSARRVVHFDLDQGA